MRNLPADLASPLRRHLSQAIAFTRPHTIVGTTVSLLALFVLARFLPTPAEPGVTALLLALCAGLGVNIYIVGLNQLTDVAVDRVNKPWLPIASGAISRRTAGLAVIAALLIAMAAAGAGSAWLLGAIAVAALIGTAYSVPPLRLKRYHPLAAGCIVTVRGLVVNLLVFAHYAAAPGSGLPLPPAIVLLSVVVVIIGLVIAWFKDLGDMEGDRRYAVATLPLRLGAPRVVAIGVGALLATYTVTAVAGVIGIPGLHGGALAVGHAGLSLRLVVALRRLDNADAASTARFYQSIWVLFSAEYVLFALAAALA